MSEGKSAGVAIVVAVIGLIGVLGAALIGNWEKMFGGSSDDSRLSRGNASASGSGRARIPDPTEVPPPRRPTEGLQSQVTDPRRRSRGLTLLLKNQTPDQLFDVPVYGLSVSDDVGNIYEFDRLAMHGAGLLKVVPPNTNGRVEYVLQLPIADDARQLNFTLSDVWSRPKTSEFKKPIAPISWTESLR